MTELEGTIGIIGGADGPTVIFISGNVTALIITAVLAVAALVAAVTAGVILWRRRRKKHQA